VRATHKVRVDLGAVARNAANLASAHPDRAEGVHVECQVPDAPLVVEGDEDLLHRAVFNLALNAVQSPARTRVTVAAEVVPPDHLPGGVTFDGGAVAVRVTDDGPGIAPEIRDRLFDPFFTTKPGGTGLGLAVVHRAIEAHRGLVFVDSTPAGTRFTALLPRQQTRAQATTPTSTAAASDRPHDAGRPDRGDGATTTDTTDTTDRPARRTPRAARSHAKTGGAT
jgi:signal transduction histidine kinase